MKCVKNIGLKHYGLCIPSQNDNSLQINSDISNELDDEKTATTESKTTVVKEEYEQCDSEDDENSDTDEFQPRIVQVTNFQQVANENQSISVANSHNSYKSGIFIKKESVSDTEKSYCNSLNAVEEKTFSDDDTVDNTLNACKPSLFTKCPKRQWPWLIDNHVEEVEDGSEDKTESSNNSTE